MFGLGLPELIVVLIIFAPAVIGALIAKSKGRNVFGWFLLCGLLWFPVIVLLFLPPTTEVEGKYRECPKCKEIIKWQASFCKHCKNKIEDIKK
jgi:hypothetical protein